MGTKREASKYHKQKKMQKECGAGGHTPDAEAQ
jgi:hypothetical protein